MGYFGLLLGGLGGVILDGVFWVKNELKTIQQFLNSYEPSQKARSERQAFSRKYQALKLLELIVDKNLLEVNDE